ncbi:type II secretion system protein [Hyphomonas neptunium ATCC 15444]|uniref:Type II secretion system protein n=2 Tax=Hyphomonas TaxID=85 RepID=Q0BZ82_HYPNA|nr:MULTISPECIES: GspE/PulE family protein [Hyphomonas]ABI77330.1 type II secretion system protein [Hyphomonas neptunium ATCC 15444]KCZ95300.1 type II secretion system protein [Hyphomonas hirschiana VP5]
MDSGSLHIAPEPEAEAAAIDWLIREGVLAEADIAHAETLKQGSSRDLLIILNQIGVLGDDALAEAYHRVTGLGISDGPFVPPPDLTQSLNPEFLRDTQALLLGPDGPLAVVNPLDERLRRGIEFALGVLPDLTIIRAGDWARAFGRFYPSEPLLISSSGGEEDAFAVEIADQERDAPIVRQVAAWLGEAADLGASDVHFDARRNSLDVRYRIDGVLQAAAREPKAVSASVVSRIKVIADLDLGERNRSQDGRSTIVVRGRRLDVRVSIIPTIDGESAVVRLLDRPEKLLSLEGLGFSGEIATALEAVCNRRHGMFVVAGPTGSGKTTTLYSCLEKLKGRGLKILSVEDPVEYHFDHVSQVQISEKAGRNFAGALRSFLRHDPDVILVGEIRDSETAQVAVQASLSGHLVLATLHAIDTARVRTRLIDMGVEPFKLDACLVASMAQRLVRLLCPDCRMPVPVTENEARLFETHGLAVPESICREKGCPACRMEGYKGRTALAEFAQNGAAPDRGQTLMAQGLQLVIRGETSLAEIAGLSEA